MKTVALMLLLCASAIGQTKTTGTAETKGACSPANTGDNNKFTINCYGISQKQADDFLTVLNKISKDQIDGNTVMTMLSTIQSLINTTGVLEPDTLPDPNFHGRPLSQSSINVFLGKNLIRVNGPSCVLLSIDGNDVLGVEKSETGMLINARVFDPSKKIMAEIVANQVTVNPNNTFRRYIGRHVLIVVDQSGNEVLHVEFLNQHAMIITGTFHEEGTGELVIDGGITMSRNATPGSPPPGKNLMSDIDVECAKNHPVFSINQGAL